MLGGFFGFRLDVELAFESDGFFVVDGHMKKSAKMVELSFEVSIPKGAVSLAAAPKHVTRPIQLVRHFNRLLYLSSGIGKRIRIATGSRAVDETRMHK